MQNYYKQDERAPRRWALVAMLLYFVGVVCILLFVSFSFDTPPPTEEGILINFGVSDTGSGVKDLAATDVVAPTPPTPKVEPTPTPPIDKGGEVDVPAPEPKQEVTPEVVEEKPRTVNQRALFPGRTESSTATSQGDSTEPTSGNQGDLSGTPEGAADGSGEGLNGVAYNLTGRSVVGSLPKPQYSGNNIGKVVIDVVVNSKGEVTAATYRAQGSTTNSTVLVDAARSAALKTQFSSGESFQQGGTITYTFTMN